jgi:putative transposase
MTSKPVALLLADLGIQKTHNRPHVSDDNPYSESQFRTLKYRREFPDRFGCNQGSRAFCQVLFHWYNEEHRHSGVSLLTPAMVHYGQAENIPALAQNCVKRSSTAGNIVREVIQELRTGRASPAMSGNRLKPKIIWP